MRTCAGHTYQSRALEREAEREAREARAEQGPCGGPTIAVPVLAAVAMPTVALFAGTPLDIIRAALEPWRRGSAT